MLKSIVSEVYLKNSAEQQQFIAWWQTLRTESQEDIEVLFDHRQDDIFFNYSHDVSGAAGWHKVPIIHCDLNRIAEKNVLEVPYTEVYDKNRDAYDDEEWTFEDFGLASYPHEIRILGYDCPMSFPFDLWTDFYYGLFRKYGLMN